MEHNQAVGLFAKANRDLSAVHNKLDKEFKQIYPDHANPVKLVQRLKKIEEEMFSSKDRCHELLSAKQDLIDKARIVLVGNRTLLLNLQSCTGAPITSYDDAVYVSSIRIYLCELQSGNMTVFYGWREYYLRFNWSTGCIFQMVF